MLKLYRPQAAERIIARLAPQIAAIEARYALPAPCLKAVLYQEITNIDLFDVLVDLLVRRNQRRGVSGPGRLKKSDSSTGYAQIFGFVAINAVNFAVDRGLTSYAALYKGVGYLPICKTCVDAMYTDFLTQCDSPKDAVRQMCRKLDLYWNEDVFETVQKKNTSR